MSATTYPAPSVAPRRYPNRRVAKKLRRGCSPRQFALLIGEVIESELRQIYSEFEVRPQNSEIVCRLKRALRQNAIFGCIIQLAYGEAHAFIGDFPDKKHGHVRVTLKTQKMVYCRGYGEPRRRRRNHFE